jgi:hypothetical protein
MFKMSVRLLTEAALGKRDGKTRLPTTPRAPRFVILDKHQLKFLTTLETSDS